MRWQRSAWLWLGILLLGGPAWAATYWISPTGNGNCLTEGSPCSFATGHALTTNGDKLMWLDGVYGGSNTYTANRVGVTWEAKNKWAAILRNTANYLLEITANNVTVRGLQVDGQSVHGNTGLVRPGIFLGDNVTVSNVTVEHMWIHHSANAGIQGAAANRNNQDSVNVIVRHNLVEYTGFSGPGEAIYFGSENGLTNGSTVTGCQVYGNTVRHFTQQGIDLKGNVHGCEVHHNVFEFQYYRTITGKTDTESTTVARGTNHYYHDNIFRNLCRPNNAVFWTNDKPGHRFFNNVVYNAGNGTQMGNKPCGLANMIANRNTTAPAGTATEITGNTFCTSANYVDACPTCNVHDNPGIPGGVAGSNCTTVEGRILGEMQNPTFVPGLNYGGTGDDTPPSAPTGVTVTSAYPTYLTVNWNAVGGDTTGYDVFYCIGPISPCTPAPLLVGALGLVTTTTYTSAVPDNHYYVGVKAFDAAGNRSALSNIANVTTPDQGLIAHWNMDQGTGTSVTDVTTNTNDGTINGTVTWIGGQIGSNALNFAGTNDWVQIPDHSTLDLLENQDFTLMFWVRSNQAATATPGFQYPQLVNKVSCPGAECTGAGIEIGLHDSTNQSGKWFANLWKNASTVYTAYGCTNLATLGAWNHLAIRRSGTTWQVFENGAQCAGTTLDTVTHADIASTSLANGTNLYWGVMSDGNSYDFLGDLDEMKLYNYALSDSEIGAEASPGVALALTHFRFGAPQTAEGSLQWRAPEDQVRQIRVNGSIRLRLQIQATAGTLNGPIPLQCREGAGGWNTLSNSCFATGVCLDTRESTRHGDPTTARHLTLPGGTSYVPGAYVMDEAFAAVTIASSEVTELEYGLQTVGRVPGAVVCCRPVKGDETLLESYGPFTDAICLTVYPGASALFGG